MTLGLRITLPLTLACQALAAELPQDFHLQGVELSLYARGAGQPTANCRVAAVFVDHRKFGFFHFRLLPVLVAQGVQIELVQAPGDRGWLANLESNLAPQVNRQAVEWRDVDLTWQRTNAPHLRAKVVRLAEANSPAI